MMEGRSKTRTVKDSTQASLTPTIHVPFGNHRVEVWESDVFEDDFVGAFTLQLRPRHKPPEELQVDGITLRLKWRKAHY